VFTVKGGSRHYCDEIYKQSEIWRAETIFAVRSSVSSHFLASYAGIPVMLYTEWRSLLKPLRP
jgi:hypothetical protein